MQLNRAMKLSLTGSIIILIVFSSILPTCVFASSIDTNDGIWTDDFRYNNTTTFLNGTSGCVWENGQIHLAKTSGTAAGRNYTFATGTSDSHRAYSNVTAFSFGGPLGRIFEFLFLSPFGLTRKEFDPQYEYPALNALKEGGDQYAKTESYGIRKNVIHHFRFQLDGTASSIGNLIIHWWGKADDAKRIEMYYWNYNNYTLLSKWIKIGNTTLTGEQELSFNMSEGKLLNALDSDNVIDICVVAYGSTTTSCTLYTDYVILQSRKQVGYKAGYGFVQTYSPITLTDATNGYWELLTWKDNIPSGTAITYQIMIWNGSAYIPVDDSLLDGNAEGFSTPPVPLTSLGKFYYNIKLQANLSTTDPTVTPTLLNWSVTWQSGSKWQDRFHSEYRIEKENNVDVNYGSVNISLVSGDWPMFGQNPENTRASSGSAALTKAVYWWSAYHEAKNEAPLTLLLDEKSLYVTTRNITYDTGAMYRYPTIIVPTTKIGDEYTSTHNIIRKFTALKGKQLIGSPAISDQYLVVAAGNESENNSVYAFQKDRPSNTPLWTFNYGTDISYWGSPIIANGHVYIASWSGQQSITGYHINNMLFALDLTQKGNMTWSFAFPPSSKRFQPNWSFSTPAFSDGKVVIGCMNDVADSLFALNADNGNLLWNTSVGSIGKAAPAIYKDTVYVVSENNKVPWFFPNIGFLKKTQVMLSAVNLENGSIRWQTLLGNKKYSRVSHLLDPTFSYAQTTPVIANGVLYVVSPDWNVTAFDLSKEGTVLWSTQIPGRSSNPPVLSSSPAYADGILYISAPRGVLWALDTSTKEFLWHYTTYNPGPSPKTQPSITTDPIVSNGLVFFGDANGRLYVLGTYVEPNRQVNGTIVSKPILIPEGYWWKKFYASMLTNQSTSVNQITFSLLDTQNNVLKTLTNGTDIALSNLTLGRSVRLRADLWAKNGSVNPRLLSWNISFIQDKTLPFINRSTLYPKWYSNIWLNVVMPQFTVNVKDNDTGLLVNSASYRLEYVAQNLTRFITKKASCTGVNGTTAVQLMTVNLSQLDFFSNITALRSLWFNISDLAGNLASLLVTFKQDTQKPSSHVLASSIKKRYNATAPFVWANASSWDNGTDASGVREVDLYYRYSTTGNFSGDWIFFANSTRRNPHFRFFFATPSQRGGYFEVATIAYDNASNNESFPAAGDASFLYDWTIPDLPAFSGQTLWFREQPQLSTTFTDDFKLDTIQYRPNFDTVWTTIASKVNRSSYFAAWQLNESSWNRMTSGQLYYLSFRITDALGNIRLVTDNSQALSIGKDIGNLNISIDTPAEKNHVITASNFTIQVAANDISGSGISEVALYYQYSKDNLTWTDWVHYDSNLTEAPFEWTFTIPDGDGYYNFQSFVVDHAGNEAQSEVISKEVVHLPTNIVLVMVALAVVLLLIGAVLYLRWKKRT